MVPAPCMADSAQGASGRVVQFTRATNFVLSSLLLVIYVQISRVLIYFSFFALSSPAWNQQAMGNWYYKYLCSHLHTSKSMQTASSILLQLPARLSLPSVTPEVTKGAHESQP